MLNIFDSAAFFNQITKKAKEYERENENKSRKIKIKNNNKLVEFEEKEDILAAKISTITTFQDFYITKDHSLLYISGLASIETSITKFTIFQVSDLCEGKIVPHSHLKMTEKADYVHLTELDQKVYAIAIMENTKIIGESLFTIYDILSSTCKKIITFPGYLDPIRSVFNRSGQYFLKMKGDAFILLDLQAIIEYI